MHDTSGLEKNYDPTRRRTEMSEHWANVLVCLITVNTIVLVIGILSWIWKLRGWL